jgi:anti-sigma regulatory factor (Ser/Thr protein kinase)
MSISPPPATAGSRPRLFSSDPAQVGSVRRFVLSHLDPTDPRRDDAGLLASELFANAITHATHRRDVKVEVVRADTGELAVSVTDGGGGGGAPVVRREFDAEDTGGRGLLLLDEIADEWGAERIGTGGMHVWFVLHTPRLTPNAN